MQRKRGNGLDGWDFFGIDQNGLRDQWSETDVRWLLDFFDRPSEVDDFILGQSKSILVLLKLRFSTRNNQAMHHVHWANRGNIGA